MRPQASRPPTTISRNGRSAPWLMRYGRTTLSTVPTTSTPQSATNTAGPTRPSQAIQAAVASSTEGGGRQQHRRRRELDDREGERRERERERRRGARRQQAEAGGHALDEGGADHAERHAAHGAADRVQQRHLALAADAADQLRQERHRRLAGGLEHGRDQDRGQELDQRQPEVGAAREQPAGRAREVGLEAAEQGAEVGRGLAPER